ncbi:hypothetical protein MKK63_25835, partial [Methylobacterium sp. J-088]|nr:hypothetical protein [Methylobacterium sp. J-088]
RLLAVSAIYAGGSRSAAAALGGVGLQTVRDWVVASRCPVCPALGKGDGLVMPRCITAAMAFRLEEIAQAVAPGAHAVLLLDQAGW